MSRRLIYLISIFMLLGLISTSSVKADLIGWWRFEEGSGDTVNDDSGNGHHGTLLGTPEWGDGPAGSGGAVVFDPDGCYGMDCGAFDPTDGTGHFSLALWASWDGTGEIQHFLTKSNGWGADTMMVQVELWAAHSSATYADRIGASYQPAGSVPFSIMPSNEWVHLAWTFDGANLRVYLNGVDEAGPKPFSIGPDNDAQVEIGYNSLRPTPSERTFHGKFDEVRIYSRALSDVEVLSVMIGEPWPNASSPTPPDGALIEDTWTTLTWRPGDLAVSHDVYLGDNIEDVNNATRDSNEFRGNQELTFYVAGFPGYAYEEGLVPGTTYYWRIDEVNDSEPNSPWKGDIWSFSIPSKTARQPVPANSAEFVPINATLTWTGGFGSKTHTVYFGEDFETVNNATGGSIQGNQIYNPGPLKLAKTYYWRVDEFDGAGTYKGEVWSFTTEGAVTGPNPADGAIDVSPTRILTWTAGAVAASHEVYFGTDADAVKNATNASAEYKGPKALGEESFDPGKLSLETTYYWRIDEVNGVNPDSPWAGSIWSYTTGNFFVIDDFELYDADDNQIWYSWHDGLGYGTPGTADYFAGNGTGAAVGDETTISYTEETIVHGGGQSMPIGYDNDKQGYSKYSEVELTLEKIRDWTEESVTELSLWFRGYPASVGGFIEAPAGTYTMTAAGSDIWNQADEFHYAYKTLTGVGSIQAQVLSLDDTDPWAKAGIMIRETLDPGSKFAAVYITPGNGCRFQARADTDTAATSDTSVVTSEQTAINAPYWVKLERDIAGNFRGYYSSNGSTWQPMAWNPQYISMSSSVYVGLALTSHDAAATGEAKFSNVTITGTVGQQWMNQDVGITSNDPDPLYVALSNTAGTSAVVTHDNPAAATIDTWTQWIIPLQVFADQGIILSEIDKIAIGLGTQGNMAIPGGDGKMFIDDIRLSKPGEVVAE